MRRRLARRLRQGWAAVALVSIGLCIAPARAQLYPPDFGEEIVASGLSGPTTLLFLPDGRLLVGEQTGAIRLWNGVLEPNPVVTIPVATQDEQGLLGMAHHPAFADSPYVYVCYTVPDSTPTDNINRIARFTMTGNSIALASERVIFDAIPTGNGYHIGGCLRIDADGNLLVATGDTGWSPPYPQDLSRLEGKLLRLRRDGTAPPDNPFVGVGGARPEIWQLGLRNPFRFSIQPGTGAIFIADVGWYQAEEVDVGPPGANFGWPLHEGPADPPNALFTDPLYWYDHSLGPAAIVGNVFYQGTLFPPEYAGNFFFLDHVRGHLGRLVLDANNQVVSAEPNWVLLDSSGWGSGPVDLALGPDGALYYCSFVPGDVRRIYYSGGGNRPPVAVAEALTPTNGYKPLAVWFDGGSSYDADGDSLRFRWDFGDTTRISTEVAPVHVFKRNGIFDVQLSVNDGRGGVTQATPIRVTVGNLAPQITIDAPADSSLFVLGQVVGWSGHAVDPEEGPVPPAQLEWRVMLHHLEHVHPVIQGAAGASGSFVAFPHDAPLADVFYRITVRASDATGLWAERSVDVRPDTAAAPVAAPPAGAAPVTRLLPNVPNPFNPSTTIRFELPGPGPARLDILDVRGALVRRLWDGERDGGVQELVWDGRTSAGAWAGSGVYVCRLEAHGARAARRIVLLR